MQNECKLISFHQYLQQVMNFFAHLKAGWSPLRRKHSISVCICQNKQYIESE